MRKNFTVLVFSILLVFGPFCTRAQSGGFWIENLQPDTIFGVVNYSPNNDGRLPLTHTLGKANHNPLTGNYIGNASVGNTELYKLNLCGWTGKTKVSIDWQLYRDGQLVNDNLSDFVEFSIYTLYRKLNVAGECQSIHWIGGRVVDGFGTCTPVPAADISSSCTTPNNYPGALQVNSGTPLSMLIQLGQLMPAQGLLHIYEALDYFYADFLQQTDNYVQIRWLQPGDYSLVMRIRERIGGNPRENLTWKENTTTDYIGGHQSCCGEILASDTISFPVLRDLETAVCENETLDFGRPNYTFNAPINGVYPNVSCDTMIVFGDVKGTGDCAFFETDSIFKVLFTPVPHVYVAEPAKVCRGNGATLTAIVDQPGDNTQHQYIWFRDGVAVDTIEYVNTYDVAATDVEGHTYAVQAIYQDIACNSDTSEAVTIPFYVKPATITIDMDSTTICTSNQASVWVTDSNTDPDDFGAVTYAWYVNGFLSPLAQSDTLLVDFDHCGSYTFWATASYTNYPCALAYSDTLMQNVVIHPYANALNYNVCPPEVIALDGNLERWTNENIHHQWTIQSTGATAIGATNASVLIAEIASTATGALKFTDSVYVDGVDGCSMIDTITVNIITPTDAFFAVTLDNSNVCEGSQVTTTAALTGTYTGLVDWYVNGIQVPGEHDSIIVLNMNQTGTYTIAASRANTVCATALPGSTGTVTVYSIPVVEITGNANTICYGENVTLQANHNHYNDPMLTFQWYYEEMNNTHILSGATHEIEEFEPTISTDYIVKVTHLTGINSQYCVAYDTFHVEVVSCTPAGDGDPCPGTPTVTDIDSNTYNTVQIGQQCWMKENLRTTHFADGMAIPFNGGENESYTIPYYYDYSSSSIPLAQRGYLYNWTAAMHGMSSSNSNPSNVQGICPNGWHLPSDAEWAQLTNYVSSQSAYSCGGDSSYIAKALASTEGWDSSNGECRPGDQSVHANNATGFSAVPAGNCYGTSFTDAGLNAYFWSSSKRYEDEDFHYSWFRCISNDLVVVDRSIKTHKAGLSVRCLRGEGCLTIYTELHDTIEASALPYIWNGQTYTYSGTFSQKFTAANGCDSVATTILTIRIPSGDAQPCPGTPTVTDIDGNTYNTVKIGNQCWMKENLRVTYYADGSPIPMGDYSHSDTYPYYYINPNIDAATYGYFYNWPAAMHGMASSNSNPSNVQGICPTGWHLPSDAEWTQLTDYVSNQSAYTCGGDSSSIAKALASQNGWSNEYNGECIPGDQSAHENNTTGFSVVPAGGYYTPDEYSYPCEFAYFTSATESDMDTRWTRNMFYLDVLVFKSHDFKESITSVRCLRDEGCLTINTVFSATVCDNELPYIWNGQTYTTSGDYCQIFTAANGCDSVVTLHLTTCTSSSDAQPCPGSPTVTDIDGNTYNTVMIGEQCWMKENLRVTRYADGTSIPIGGAAMSDTNPYYYINPNLDTTIYGYYYNWAAAMHGDNSSNSNPSNVQGVCPNGWHLPSDTEWTQLTYYVSHHSEYTCGDIRRNIAKALASQNGWSNEYNSECIPGDQSAHENNTTGFSAVPADVYYGTSFYSAGYYALFWSSTETDPSGVWCRSLSSGSKTISRGSDGKRYGSSVRCLLNPPCTPTTSEFSTTSCDDYTWNGQIYTESGDYTQTFTNIGGCDSVVTLHLTIHPTFLVEVYASENAICLGNSTTLTAEAGDNTELWWSHGATSSTTTVFPDSTTTYHVTATTLFSDGSSCSADGEITIYVYPQTPIPSISADEILVCNGEQVTLMAINDDYSAESYIWYLDGVEVPSENLSTFAVDIGAFGIGSHHISVKAVSNWGCISGASEEYTVTVNDCNPSGDSLSCPGIPTVTDYDGNIYYTVQIGDQCWMRENLRTTHYANGEAIPTGSSLFSNSSLYAPNNDESTVSTYGYLYIWTAIMHNSGSSSANPSGVQGICPTGWHVPSDAEWSQLTNYVSSVAAFLCNSSNSSNSIAKALSAAEGWRSNNGFGWFNNDEYVCTVGNNPSTNNATGFNVRPAGCRNSSSQQFNLLYDFKDKAYLWTATENSGTIAKSRSLAYNSDNVNASNANKSFAYSVRCLLNPPCTPNTSEFSDSSCDDYTWNGQTYTVSGDYTQTFTAANGCDSVVTLHLTIHPTYAANDTRTICPSALPYLWNGVIFTSAGTQSVTLQTVNGCDSVVTMTLAVSSAYHENLNVSACNSYTWNGATYTQSGDYTRTFTAANGCDSVVTLHLTVNHVVITEFSASTCNSYTWSGTTYTQSGNYTKTFTAANGCDSLVTLHLTITTAPQVTLTTTYNTICDGGATTIYANVNPNTPNMDYTWYRNGVELVQSNYSEFTVNEAGSYRVKASANGCSTMSDPLVVTVNPAPQVELTSTENTICSGGTAVITAAVSNNEAVNYYWSNNYQGSSYTFTPSASGTYTFSVTAGQTTPGCMAADTITITVNPIPEPPVIQVPSDNICEGNIGTLTIINAQAGAYYTWLKNGAVIPATSTPTYTEAFSTLNGNPTYYTYSAFCMVPGSGCVSNHSQNAIIHVVPSHTVTVTATETTICEGGMVTLSANVTPVNGAYTYQWYKDNVLIPGATSQIYIATEVPRATAYSYRVLVTSVGAECYSYSNPVDITFISDPVVTITRNSEYPATVCDGGSTILQANVTDGFGWTSYQWYKNGILLPGETVAGLDITNLAYGTNDIYTVDITQTGNNCAGTASAALNTLVTVVPTYIVNISGISNICEGGEITLNATVNGVISGDVLSYQWYKVVNGNSTIISGATSDSYTTSDLSSNYYEFFVVATSSISTSCSTVSTIIPVNVVSQPTVTLQAPSTICESGNLSLTAFVSGGVDGSDYTYTWNWTGAANGTATTAVPTFATTLTANDYAIPYYFTVTISRTDNTGCNATSVGHEVNVLAVPTVSVTADNAYVCPNGEVTFTANVSPVGSYNYVWTINGQQLPVNAATVTSSLASSGTISASVDVSNAIAASACSATATLAVPVHVVNAPSVTIFADHTSLCAGGTVTLTSNISATGNIPDNYSHHWALNYVEISGANANTLAQTLNNPGIYNLTYKVTHNSIPGCNSSWSAPVTVIVAEQPVVTLNGNDALTFCEGGSATMTGVVTNYNNTVNGVTNSSIYGAMTFNWTANGVSIQYNSNVTTAQNQITNILNFVGSYNYQVSVDPSGYYCNAQSSNILTVNVVSDPSWTNVHVNGSNGTDVCRGEIITLSANIIGGLGYSDANIQWVVNDMNGNTTNVSGGSGGSSSDLPTNLGSYIYHPIFIGDLGNGCEMTNTNNVQTMVTVHELPTAAFIGGDGTELCANVPGASAEMVVAFTGVAPFTYRVTDNTGNEVVNATTMSNTATFYVSPSATTTYTISSIQDNYCSNISQSGTTSATVYVVNCPTLPTVITGPITEVTDTLAIVGGEVLDEGFSTVTERGVCWSTEPMPSVEGFHTVDGAGLGEFTSQLTKLSPATTYYVRAYATNEVGIAYGNEVTFTTAEQTDTNHLSEMIVYPNPAYDVIHLLISDTSLIGGSSHLFLYDAAGHRTHLAPVTDANTEISCAGLNQGVYFLELNVDGINVKTFKIIIKKQ